MVPELVTALLATPGDGLGAHRLKQLRPLLGVSLDDRSLMKADIPLVSRASLMVVEANLSVGAIRAACEVADSAGLPIFMEPVSVAKAIRCGGWTGHGGHEHGMATGLRRVV